MALRNLRRPKPELIEEYALSYEWDNMPGAGFSFPCYSDGTPMTEGMDPAALENLRKAQNGEFNNLEYRGIVDHSRTFKSPMEGVCDCGETVVLDYDNGHGIDCSCGRIYNLSGSQLAPRSQWEERYDEESTVPYYLEFGSYVP